MTSRWTACALAALACWAALAQTPDAPAAAPTPAATAAPVEIDLPGAVQRVLQAHPDVHSARAAYCRALAQARVAAAERWPQVSLNAGVARIRSLARPVNTGGGTVTGSGGLRTTSDADISLQYDLYSSGRSERIAQAEVQAQAQCLGLPDVQRQLAFQVRQTYYRILANRQVARALMQSVAASERHRELVEARIEEGVAPRSDLLPVQVEVSQARLQAVQAETTLRVAEAALKALLLLPAETQLVLAPVGTAAPTALELPQALELARQHRPDVRQQELSIRNAELATRLARIDRGPQLNVSADADYGHHTDVVGESWTLQVGVTYPLFTGGAAEARVEAARASEEIERQQLAALLLQVQEDVESAHAQLRQSAVALTNAATARQAAAEALAAAEARYAEGLAIIIEVTDAQVDLLQAQVAEAQAQLDLQTALAALDLATGILTQPETSPTGEGT